MTSAIVSHNQHESIMSNHSILHLLNCPLNLSFSRVFEKNLSANLATSHFSFLIQMQIRTQNLELTSIGFAAVGFLVGKRLLFEHQILVSCPGCRLYHLPCSTGHAKRVAKQTAVQLFSHHP